MTKPGLATCAVAAAALLVAVPWTPLAAQQDRTAEVTFTWLSNTAWLIEAGETTILFDGTVSRLAEPAPGTVTLADRLQQPPEVPDADAVRRVYDALDLASEIDVILVGHGHPDHAFDTAAWARLTGARVIGSRTVCFQVYAQGLPEPRCRIVEGGESLELGPDVRARVVRWHHSGDPADPVGRLVQSPLELAAVPTPDPATGGLRTFRDFPNGGGARAFLFRYGSGTTEVTWFVSNTGNAALFDRVPEAERRWFEEQGLPLDNLEIVQETTATRTHLERGLAAEGIATVDLWIGYGGQSRHVSQVAAILEPTAFIPHHWGGVGARTIFDGISRPYANENLANALKERGVQLFVQTEFGARYRLGPRGLQELPSDDLRRRLGLGRERAPVPAF